MSIHVEPTLEHAIALHQAGQLEAAQSAYQEILLANPQSLEARNLLGAIALQTGRAQQAWEVFEQVIRADPIHVVAYCNAAQALRQLGRFDQALLHLDRAIELTPDMAEVHYHRGNILRDLKRWDAALESYRRVLALDPDYVEAYCRSGDTLLELKQAEAALARYDQALALIPEYEEAHLGRALALHLLKQPEAALLSCDQAIALRPDYAGAHFNRGNVLFDLGRYADALASYDQAIALQTDYAQAHLNRSVILLLQGDFEQGWAGYEWRWRINDSAIFEAPCRFEQPVWRGEAIAGKAILLYGEQGLGDSIQFSRYAIRLAELGAKVLMQVPGTLKRLLSTLPNAPQIFAVGEALPPFDYHCSLLSLPCLFKTDLQTIPAAQSYLFVPPAQSAPWQQRLRRTGRPRVGLVWSGGARHLGDAERSLPLSELLPHLPDDFQYVSLQKEFREQDRSALSQTQRIEQFAQELRDLGDTAALCECMDLVITVDTSVAHLSAALGKNTWLLLPFVPDWRWMLDRDDTPWYPTMKLYRQPRRGDWHPVLTQVANDLVQLRAARSWPHTQPLDEPVALDERAKLDYAEAYCRSGDTLLELQQVDAARDSYDRALALVPDFEEAHLGHALVLQAQKQPQAALRGCDRAIALKPTYVMAHFHRANLLAALKRFEEALASYDETLALKNDFADAYSNRAIVLNELERLPEALASCDRAIELRRDYAEAHHNRGNVLARLGRFAAALASYDAAIASRETYVEAWFNRAHMQTQLNQLEASLASFDRVIALRSTYAEAHSNRGIVLGRLGRATEAIASFDRAIALKPDYADAYTNRGVVLRELQDLEAAMDSHNRAIALNPQFAEAYCNRGNVLRDLKRMQDAIADYERALALKPDFADAYFNRGLTLLALGNFQQGWRDYEWRWKGSQRATLYDGKAFSQPLWLGTPSLSGKTILLYGEQGLGDTLQFCRYAPLVAKLGARLLLEVPRPLKTLLEQLEGVSQVIARGDPLPSFDVRCPLLSLPLAFGTDAPTIPHAPRYLTPDAAKVARWQHALGSGRQPRVGLVWSGGSGYKNDRNRSVTLAQWLPHLPEGFQYVSLQKELREHDRRTLEEQARVQQFSQLLADFSDTAALCACMDLVISVDTSVAHLSAALGKPTWILLSLISDWRWQLDRRDSPWYPTARLYRQLHRGEWTDVFTQIASDLRQIRADTAAR